MKANRTGETNPPPKIEDLKDGTFYYNFNVAKTFQKEEGTNNIDVNWDYHQMRLSYPVDVGEIQTEVDKQGYEHTVNIQE